MKKIDGTLYSPNQRTKMHVQTVPEAIVMDDGSTLQERIDTTSKGIVVSTSKPSKECLWVNPSGINPSTYFNFNDVNITVPEDSTEIHTLKTPADKNGVRENVYPLTDAKSVKVTNNKSINDVFNNYDMGFEVGREKPDHKSLWANELFQTATVDDVSGKEEEIFLLNEVLGTKVNVNGTTYNANNYVFTINSQKMIIFNTPSDLVETNDTTPNRTAFWVDELYKVYPNEPDLSDFLLDTVIIDDREYTANNKVFTYSSSNWVFINPEKYVKSDTIPKVYEDSIWANTNV